MILSYISAAISARLCGYARIEGLYARRPIDFSREKFPSDFQPTSGHDWLPGLSSLCLSLCPSRRSLTTGCLRSERRTRPYLARRGFQALLFYERDGAAARTAAARNPRRANSTRGDFARGEEPRRTRTQAALRASREEDSSRRERQGDTAACSRGILARSPHKPEWLPRVTYTGAPPACPARQARATYVMYVRV